MRRCRIKEPVFRLAVRAGCGLFWVTAPLSHSPAAIGSVSARKEEHVAHTAAARRTERAQPSERAFLQQAQGLLRRGQMSTAVAALEKGLVVYPRSAALHYLAARIRAQQRDYAGARRHYERVVALAPDKTEGFFGLAQIAFAQRDYPASAAALRRVIRLDPRSATAYAKLGRVYTDTFDTPRALETLRKAITLDPNSEEAQFYMGDLLLRMSRLDEAQPYLERAVALAPGNPRFQASLGDLFLQRQENPTNTAHALAAYQESIRLDPRLAAAHYGLGRVYARQRRWREAAEELQTTLQLDPTFGRAHYTLAQVCRRLGQPAEAAKHLEAFRRFRARRGGRREAVTER